MTRDEMDEIQRHFESATAETKSYFEQATAETKRHFDVVAEGLTAQIRLVAEGHVLLADEVHAVKVDVREFRAETRHEFTELRAMLKLSYAELEGRVTRLEGALADVVGRLERLEQRTHA
ncbi:MAG: hypothetical protein HY825_19320 [Acidobacteria bacterium]|nr:hypothetical protein [Acidobacteriota bacterium]